MTNPNFAGDEYSEGALAARQGHPFSEWTTRPWQAGYTDEKRRQALKTLGPVKYHFVSLVLETLRIVCTILRTEGTEAADLARACATRVLAGDDLKADVEPNGAAV